MVLFTACGADYSPKPSGYFRIDLPQKNYQLLDSTLPYRFEYPGYTTISNDPLSPQEDEWINLNFPQFKGTLHLSYKNMNGDLNTYIEDSRAMVFKHIPKASAINDRLIINNKEKVYGLLYEIGGIGAASPCQFYLTDSVNHFLRGALYFSVKPNNDSLAPVIEYLKQDIEHLISTLSWKN